MKRLALMLLLCSTTVVLSGQVEDLPHDLRQHNMMAYTASLWHPTYSWDYNYPQSLAMWSRWQWQDVDTDPSTLFINYTRSINGKSAFALGYFQNNSGNFLQRGGVANYSYAFTLGPKAHLVVGANVFGFAQELLDDRMQPPIVLPGQEMTTDFVMQLSPGLRLLLHGWEVAVAAENAMAYNFSKTERVEEVTNFVGILSYTIPLHLFGETENTFLQPSFYVKTLPNFENQVGGKLLLSTKPFWAQLGYNNFYGFSAGAGARLFGFIHLGGLMEFGVSGVPADEKPSVELVTAINFGQQKLRRPLPVYNRYGDELELLAEEEEKTELEENQEAVAAYEEKNVDVLPPKEQEVPEKEESPVEEVVVKEGFVKDSIAPVAVEPAVETEAARIEGRYEEVDRLTGTAPGYYLIANVFGTEKYYRMFMELLTKRDLNPKSFKRDSNGYHYVYLGYYPTAKEAQAAKKSQLQGRYKQELWIFRVVGE